jgi:hypothetical protein
MIFFFVSFWNQRNRDKVNVYAAKLAAARESPAFAQASKALDNYMASMAKKVE